VAAALRHLSAPAAHHPFSLANTVLHLEHAGVALHAAGVGASMVPAAARARASAEAAAAAGGGGDALLAQLHGDLKARLNPGALKFLLGMERRGP
jgi:hypothetical protein